MRIEPKSSLGLALLGAGLLACSGGGDPIGAGLSGASVVSATSSSAESGSGAGGEIGTTAGSVASSGSGGSAACAPVAAKALFAAAGWGDVCNGSAALVSDGDAAGLDFVSAPMKTIDGQLVASCVGGDFGGEAPTRALRLTLGSSPKACDGSCGTPYCGTSDAALIFHGSAPDGSDLHFDGAVSLVGELFIDYDVPIEGSVAYAVVCRGSGGPKRDDVNVDGIARCP